jgi:beta-lactamase class A
VIGGLVSVGGLSAVACAPAPRPSARATGLDTAHLNDGFGRMAGEASPGVFDFGVMTLDGPAIWSANADGRFPLEGLATLPIVVAALAQADAGTLTMNEALRVTADDLSPPPSRVNEALAASQTGAIELPAADLIALALLEGDATAADVVLARAGGPRIVTAWLAGQGVTDMRVDRYARQRQTDIMGLGAFQPAWSTAEAWSAARQTQDTQSRESAMADYLADPRDTATVAAVLALLGKVASGALLRPASTGLLLRLMSSSLQAKGRLQAGLPADASLAHLAGTSVTDLGLTAGANDAGIVTLADGRRFAVAGLLSGSTATAARIDSLFTEAARLSVASLR